MKVKKPPDASFLTGKLKDYDFNIFHGPFCFFSIGSISLVYSARVKNAGGEILFFYLPKDLK